MIDTRSVPTRRAKASLAVRDPITLCFTFATPVHVGWIAPATIVRVSVACQTVDGGDLRLIENYFRC